MDGRSFEFSGKDNSITFQFGEMQGKKLPIVIKATSEKSIENYDFTMQLLLAIDEGIIEQLEGLKCLTEGSFEECYFDWYTEFNELSMMVVPTSDINRKRRSSPTKSKALKSIFVIEFKAENTETTLRVHQLKSKIAEFAEFFLMQISRGNVKSKAQGLLGKKGVRRTGK